MRRVRYLAFVLLAGATFGSLAITGGWAWYLRSERYRRHCSELLGEHLGLEAEIGQVVPRSRTAREFRDVRVWLPEQRGEAAFCNSAILTKTPSEDDPEAYELELRGGRSEISTRTWLRADYRAVLESGLRPGFTPGGPRRVTMTGMDLAFERERFRMRLEDTSGVVLFDNPELGRARLACEVFNGHRAGAPVTLSTEFSPQAHGIRLDRVELTVPRLPIAIVGLNDLVALDLQAGTFEGRLGYRETGGHREVTLAGKLFDLELAECTARFAALPWRGSVPELEVEELTFVDRYLQRVRLRGLLTGVVLGDVLEPWGLGAVGGHLALRIRTADVSAEGIESLIAAARCDDLSLDELSEALGWGQMTGSARVIIDDLTIRQNSVESLDAEVLVEPDDDEEYYITRELLLEVLRRTSGIEVPEPLLKMLPERIPYTQLGVRLEIRDEVLHVFGTHGPREQTILSVSLGGQELPVIREPQQPFDLKEHLDRLRTELRQRLEQRLRGLTPEDAWRAISGPADSERE